MLWRLLRVFLRRELPDLMENDISLQAMGRLDALPPQVRRELDSAVAATSGNGGMRLNLAINYSGRAELVDAINSIVEEARLSGKLSQLRVDEDQIAARLYTAGLPDPDPPDPHLGRDASDNFLLWQIAYAELYVTGTLWPDFRRGDLLNAILAYQKRDGVRRPARRATQRRAARTPRPRVPPRMCSNGWAPADDRQWEMKRVLTALVLIPSVTYLILWAPQLLFLLALAVIAGLCFFEFDGLVSHHAIPRPGLLGAMSRGCCFS